MAFPTSNFIPVFEKESILNGFGTDAFAILINEDDDTLDESSLIADIVGKELADANGYTRQGTSLTLSQNGAIVTAQFATVSFSFTAVSTFSHVVFLKDALSTIGDTTGSAWFVYPVNAGASIDRTSGDPAYEVSLHLDFNPS